MKTFAESGFSLFYEQKESGMVIKSTVFILHIDMNILKSVGYLLIIAVLRQNYIRDKS